MIYIIRWLAFFPAALLASIAFHVIISFVFGIAHGFEDVAFFWESNDMAGMPISRTYILFTTRTVATVIFIAVAAGIAPQYKKKIAFTLVTIIIAAWLAPLAYVVFNNISTGSTAGFSVWYRSILEMASVMFGCVIGGGIASDMELGEELKNNATKSYQ